MALDKDLGWKNMKSGRRHKQILMGNLKRLQTNPREAGLSTSQQEEMASAGADAAARQSGKIAEDLSTAGLGSGWSGQMAEAARQGTRQASAAGAAARADAYKYSDQLAKQFAKETRAGLERQFERRREDQKFWGKQAVEMGKAAAAAAKAAME